MNVIKSLISKNKKNVVEFLVKNRTQSIRKTKLNSHIIMYYTEKHFRKPIALDKFIFYFNEN